MNKIGIGNMQYDSRNQLKIINLISYKVIIETFYGEKNMIQETWKYAIILWIQQIQGKPGAQNSLMYRVRGRGRITLDLLFAVFSCIFSLRQGSREGFFCIFARGCFHNPNVIFRSHGRNLTVVPIKVRPLMIHFLREGIKPMILQIFFILFKLYFFSTKLKQNVKFRLLITSQKRYSMPLPFSIPLNIFLEQVIFFFGPSSATHFFFVPSSFTC